MLKEKFTRHTTAFVSIAIASIFIYPAAQAGMEILTWTLLALIGLAASLTLTTK